MAGMMRATSMFAIVAALIYTTPVSAAESAKSPHQIISDLQQRFYSIGETGAKPASFINAEATAAEQLATYINDDSNSVGLTEKDKGGMTPLIKAAYMGYAKIAETLLQSPAVTSSIEETDNKGVSAWEYSNFAIRQSVLACYPTVAQNIFAFVPIYVSQPYYLATDPYHHIRKRLADAGAKTDIEGAKASWSKICTQQSEPTRTKISASKDVLDTVIAEGDAGLAAFTLQMQKNASPTNGQAR